MGGEGVGDEIHMRRQQGKKLRGEHIQLPISSPVTRVMIREKTRDGRVNRVLGGGRECSRS